MNFTNILTAGLTDGAYILISCFLTAFITQLIKVIAGSIKAKKIKTHYFLAAGGMPSSHTSTVVTLVMSIGLYNEWVIDTTFAFAVVFAVIIMHDACNVRLESGKHAKLLNTIIEDSSDEKINCQPKLKKSLGHTPLEVFAGAILGFVLALIFYMIF